MSSVSSSEIAQFSSHAGEWWNPDGAFRPLHRLNPVRLEYVRDQTCLHFQRDAAARQSLKGMSVLDIGCGGGLMCEPLARLGAKVTGIDASSETIGEAKRHAALSRLSIDYRVASVEDLALNNSLPLAGRVREGGVKQETPSPVKTKDLLRKSKFSLPLPQGERKYDVITALEVAEHVEDMNSFLDSVAALLKPRGLLIMSTLNRTPKSFLLGIVAAEYILNWVPRGTHQWKKFIRPSELVGNLQRRGLQTTHMTGLIFNPLTQMFELHPHDLAVNYLLSAKRA